MALAIIGLVSGGSMLLAEDNPIYELWEGSSGYIIVPLNYLETVFDTYTVTDWHIGNLMPHVQPPNPTGVSSGYYSIYESATYFYTDGDLSGSFAGIIHTENSPNAYWYYGEGTWTSNLGYYGTWTGAFDGGSVGDDCTITLKRYSPGYGTLITCGQITGECKSVDSREP